MYIYIYIYIYIHIYIYICIYEKVMTTHGQRSLAGYIQHMGSLKFQTQLHD